MAVVNSHNDLLEEEAGMILFQPVAAMRRRGFQLQNLYQYTLLDIWRQTPSLLDACYNEIYIIVSMPMPSSTGPMYLSLLE